MSAAIRFKSVSLAIFLVLLFCLTTTHVRAEQAVPIKVKAVVESTALRRAWGVNRIPQIEKALAEHWRMRLSKRYRHWDFHTEEDQQSFAVVTLKVVEPESRKVEIAMVAERADGFGFEELWTNIWLKPVDFDLGRRPAGQRAEHALREKSEALFRKPEEERVMSWLSSKVPLGKGGQWKSADDSDELRVITSLPWSRFQMLKSSVFKVLCREQDQHLTIKGEGTLDPLPYEVDSGSSYDALVLKPDKRPANELDNIEVQIIYLLEERDPVLDFFL